MTDLDRLDLAKGGGLVTVVTQDVLTGEVLMVAHGDRETLTESQTLGEMVYRSRTRGRWHKGATSGNKQRLVDLALDCDGDSVLARVIPAGPACHTGARSCFEAPAATPVARLDAVITSRAETGSEASYTATLLGDRNRRLKKLTEEAGELAVACADGNADQAVEEAADLVYHTLVALRALGRGWHDVERVLDQRRAPKN